MSLPNAIPGLYPYEIVLLPNQSVQDDYATENFEYIQNNWLYMGFSGPITIGGVGAPASSAGQNGDFYFRSDGTSANFRLYHKESGSWVGVI
jgi:hypothetical protein